MNILVDTATWCYQRLLQLLPHEFREDFGAEMQFIFSENLRTTVHRGLLCILQTCFRELNGWLGLFFCEHWFNLRKSFGWNAPGFSAGLPALQTEWRLALNTEDPKNIWHFPKPGLVWLATLPPLIFGLGGALASLAGLSRNLYWVVAIWGFSVLVIAAGGLVALLRRLPDWGWTWLGSSLMLFAVTLKILAEELAETGGYILSAAGDLALMGIILLAGFILLLAAAQRGWQPAGLVSIGYTAIFGLTNLSLLNSAPFSRTDLALLVLPVGIIFAGLTLFFIRGSNTSRMLLLACAWVLNAGIFYLGYWVWLPWLTESGGISPLIPLLVLSTGFVLSGPLVGVLRRPFMKMLHKI